MTVVERVLRGVPVGLLLAAGLLARSTAAAETPPPATPPAAVPAGVPAGEVVWSGTTRIQGKTYPARLYRVASRAGARQNQIDRALALVAFGAEPPRSLLLLIGGSRGPGASRSFSTELGDGYVSLGKFLDAGYALASVEYRGSQTPGKKDRFEPPLPAYGELIPGFDTDAACEYGVGDGYDAVAVARYLSAGGAFPVPAGRSFVLGGSHGGYLALRVARDVDGLEGVAAGHPPVDLKGCLEYFESAPSAFPPSFPGQSPALAVNFPVKGSSARLGYRDFAREMGGAMASDPSTSLLDAPPRAKRILLWSNLDDWLVPAFNSRRYMSRWAESRKEIHYYEYASDEVPELFPAYVEKQRSRQLASTHQEELPGTALEKHILRVCGLEPGELEIDPPHRGPITVDVTLDLTPLAEKLGSSVAGASVRLHDGTGWRPVPAREGKADEKGQVHFAAAPAGFQWLDLNLVGGRRVEGLSIYLPRKVSGAVSVFDLGNRIK